MMREQLSVEDYLSELLALARPDQRAEELPLSLAVIGRVLAAPVTSTVAIPVFDNSAMDGYAVRFAEMSSLPVQLRVIGDIAAGSAADPEAGAGECVRIMTGAPLPTFADTVIPVEDTDGGQTVVTIAKAPKPGAHVRRAGEDVSAGAVLAAAGTVLSPAVIGALIAGGAATVSVRPRPVVAIAATGDELAAAGTALSRGQIHESNSITIAGMLAAGGIEVRRADPIPDRREALIAWLDEITGSPPPGLDPGSGNPAGVDLVVLTGGASVGAYDVVRDVLTEKAGGSFRHVRMQPGKPQGWAVWPGGTPVLALPGNPVSAALSCQLFVLPLLDHLLGRPAPPDATAVAGASWASPAGRRQFIPVRLDTDAEGRLTAVPSHLRGSASHAVTSLAGADAVAIIAEEVTGVVAGDLLRVRMLR